MPSLDVYRALGLAFPQLADMDFACLTLSRPLFLTQENNKYVLVYIYFTGIRTVCTKALYVLLLCVLASKNQNNYFRTCLNVIFCCRLPCEASYEVINGPATTINTTILYVLFAYAENTPLCFLRLVIGRPFAKPVPFVACTHLEPIVAADSGERSSAAAHLARAPSAR